MTGSLGGMAGRIGNYAGRVGRVGSRNPGEKLANRFGKKLTKMFGGQPA